MCMEKLQWVQGWAVLKRSGLLLRIPFFPPVNKVYAMTMRLEKVFF